MKIMNYLPLAMKLRKACWIGHILSRNCFIKHTIQGKMEWKRRRGRRRKQILYIFKGGGKIMKLELGNTRAHSVANSLWKRPWNSRKCVEVTNV